MQQYVCFSINTLNYKSVSNNASNFQVVLSVNGILKYLRQL